MSEEKLNLYQRINKIMQSVDFVEKDGSVKITTKTGKEFSYKAVTHDAVTDSIRAGFVEWGVWPAVSVVDTKTNDTRTEVKVSVTFINMDNPDERHELFGVAHADDSGDKATGKAISMAVKYVYLKSMMLITGEDEEQREKAKGKKLFKSARERNDAWNVIVEKIKTAESVDDVIEIWKSNSESLDNFRASDQMLIDSIVGEILRSAALEDMKNQMASAQTVDALQSNWTAKTSEIAGLRGIDDSIYKDLVSHMASVKQMLIDFGGNK